MIIQLKRAIPRLNRDDGSISAVNVREYITAGDMLAQQRAARRDATDAENELVCSLTLIAKLCGLDMKEVESLDVADVNAITSYVAGLLKTEAEPDPKG